MNINFSNQTFAQRKIPRNLYHLTTKENYLSMLKDGFIKTSHDVEPSSSLEGVFLFDITNFVKRWSSTGLKIDFLKTPLTLAKALLLNVAIKNPEIVLLKIPTKNLLKNNLFCRAQICTKNIPLEHEINGDLATNQRHYTRKKYPIEYIYQSKIPIEKVEKIGELDTKISIKKTQDIAIYEHLDTLEFFSKLFNNTPEQKNIELAKKNSFKFRELFD